MKISNKKLLNVTKIIEKSQSNGPGIRAVIWFQGCNRHCRGCYNQEMWSFDKKELISPLNLFRKIQSIEDIEGITLTGGEPLLQASTLIDFLKLIRSTRLSVICFTGYELNEICKPEQLEILKHIDILKTGNYNEELYEEDLPLRGSSNQKLVFLTDRYSFENIKQEQIFEIFISENKIQITGFPPKNFLKEVFL